MVNGCCGDRGRGITTGRESGRAGEVGITEDMRRVVMGRGGRDARGAIGLVSSDPLCESTETAGGGGRTHVAKPSTPNELRLARLGVSGSADSSSRAKLSFDRGEPNIISEELRGEGEEGNAMTVGKPGLGGSGESGMIRMGGLDGSEFIARIRLSGLAGSLRDMILIGGLDGSGEMDIGGLGGAARIGIAGLDGPSAIDDAGDAIVASCVADSDGDVTGSSWIFSGALKSNNLRCWKMTSPRSSELWIVSDVETL